MKKYFAVFFCLVLTTQVYASGSGGHGSVADLIAPLVNVLILVSALVWFLKEPLRKYFTQFSEDISHSLERANLKSKEAQVMLEVQKRKMDNLNSEVSDIKNKADQSISDFEKKYQKEVEDKVFKLKEDANLKIEAEKRNVVEELNNKILKEVIAKTKSTITQSNEYKNKANENMLSGIQ